MRNVKKTTLENLEKIDKNVGEFKSTLNDSISDIEKNIIEEKNDLKNASILNDLNSDSIESDDIKSPKKNAFFSVLKVLFLLACLGIVLAYAFYKFLDARNFVDKWFIRGSYVIISLIAISLFFNVLFSKKSLKNFFGICTVFLLVVYVFFNLANEKGYLKLPGEATVLDFKGMAINEALKWAQDYHVLVEQQFEYSDNYRENEIITQDVRPDTLVKNVKNIKFIISSGPSYDKELVVPDMVGFKADEVIKFVKGNFLNNVTINYQANNDVAKDLVISQSYKGQMKRSGKLDFTISLGRRENLQNVKIDDLKNKSEFDATLWLKQHGINYDIKYEFSDSVKKGYVLSQSTTSTIDPNIDKISLTVSKGKKIVVPELLQMTVEQVTNWVIENNLKIYFAESYDSYAKEGAIIKVNLKKGDEITEGETVNVTTSKGQLKFPDFDSLASFRSWAGNNNIKIKEDYEYHDTIAKGNIIKFSLKKGDTVILENTITVTVSNGKAVSVPNFVGMNKTNITNKCNSLGIYCTFYYTGYSNTARDVATTQSVYAGNTVMSGTNINIGLSSGPAQSFNVYIQSEWFSPGSPDGTINTLKSKLASLAPGVTFNFVKKASNTGAQSGFIHESSPVKGGPNTFVQGKTYTIWVIN